MQYPGFLSFMMKLTISLVLLFTVGYLYAVDWTVLVYMAADNDLATQAKLVIQQMEEAIQPRNLNLVVQTDIAGEGAKRYRIAEHPAPGIGSPVLQNLGDVDSGDPKTLRNFINWGFNRYPSQRRMLILWSHADSWYKQSKDIAPDMVTGNAISVANGELMEALKGTPHLDILLFDACSMQSIEIAYELRYKADFIVGSADLVPVKGFPYSTMIPLFEDEPLLVASQIPQLYTDSYLPRTPNNPSDFYLTTTCSTLKTSVLDSVYSRFQSVIPKLFAHSAEMMTIRETLYEMNSGYADVDMYQMLVRMRDQNIIPQELDAMLLALDELILTSSYTMQYPEQDLSSLAIWFPDIRQNFNAAWKIYMQLSFAENQWLSVVNSALGDQIPPDAPSLGSVRQRLATLQLSLVAPLDPDSLTYFLKSDHANFEILPPAYATDFLVSFIITGSGRAQIYAKDRAGNISEALIVNYEYEEVSDGFLTRPNPALRYSVLFIDWHLKNTNSTQLKLRLYDIRGRLLNTISHAEFAETGSLRIDDLFGLHTLPRGVYVLELQSDNKRFRRKLALR